MSEVDRLVSNYEFKAHLKPRVYMLAYTTLCNDDVEEFLKDANVTWGSYEEHLKPADEPTFPGGHLLPELAGRVCYMSFGSRAGRKTEDYLRHIIEVGHGSVLEHSNVTLLFTGVSRSLTHELVRHRAGFGYSQLSQRYVPSEEAECVIPPRFLQDDDIDSVRGVLDGFAESLSIYSELTDRLSARMETTYPELSKTDRRKAAREAARCVLPNSTETKIVVTANLRAWRHFLTMRASGAADAEIRRLAVHYVYPTLMTYAPYVFGDFEVKHKADGMMYLTTPNTKV